MRQFYHVPLATDLNRKLTFVEPYNSTMETITAQWILPVTSSPLWNHAVDIEGSKIERIRPLNANEAFLPGSCLIPGLVNTHTHLAYTALRNLFDDLPFFQWIRKLTETKYQKMTEDDVAASARLGISECIQAGITTVADLSDLEISLRELAASPLRGIFYWEAFGVERQQADETWRALQETFPKLVSRYSSSRLQIGLSPHSCYTVRPELYQRIATWALKENIPISFHLSESREEEQFIRDRSGPIEDFLQTRIGDWKISGKTSVEHLAATGIYQTKPLVAHLVQTSDSDLDLLAATGVSVAHCPKSNSKFAHGIAPLIKMRMKGMRVGLGTDSAASNNRLDLFEEARLALFQQRANNQELVLDSHEVLRMMTLEGAQAMNLDDRIGSIEIGKEADLVLIKIPAEYKTETEVLNHLIFNTTTSDVLATYIAGELVFAKR